MQFAEKIWPKLPSISQMRAWDAQAVNFGIPDSLLMENAARSAIQVLSSSYGSFAGKNILLFMGSGNNGGDAACIARILHDHNHRVLVAHTKRLEELKGAAAFHSGLATKDSVNFYHLIPEDFQALLRYLRKIDFAPDIIIDGLIGISLHGQLSDPIANLINEINYFASSHQLFVLSIDVPSGLNADTGLPMPCAIRANVTATMAFAKKGLVLTNAKNYVGDLYICDIGMPKIQEQERKAELKLLDARLLLTRNSLPKNSHKNTFGHVILIGGKQGLSGAAHIAAFGALRTGAGLLTACAPPASVNQVKGNIPEIMTLKLGQADSWPEEVPENLKKLIDKSQTLAIGPGMGRDQNSEAFLHSLLLLKERPPTVLDADALFLLAKNPEWFGLLRSTDVLTPHPGEAALLLNCSVKQLEADRLKAILSLQEKLTAVVVLKGVNTLVGQKAMPTLLCPFDVPQMAIGGSGDALCGCIAAILADKSNSMPTLISASLGVIKHICAGLICTREFPQRGALASDLANAFAKVAEFVASLDKKPLEAGLAPWPK